MIVLITNAISPYGYDIQQVLGLPNGGNYRFRYRPKWVHSEISTTYSNPTSGLIVLRDKSTGTLTPIRHIEIFDTGRIGEAIVLHFSIKDYIHPSDAEAIIKSITSWQATNNVENKPGNDLKYLVFKLPEDISPTKVDPDTAWTTVLKSLGKIQLYDKFGFIRITSLESDGKQAKSTSVGGHQHAFVLAPGKTYTLKAAEYMPSQITDSDEAIQDPFDVTLHAPSDFSLIRGTQRVVGKYDELRFVFTVPESFAGKTTEISLSCDQPCDAKKYGISNIALPIKVRRKYRSLIIVVIAFGLYFLSESIPKSGFTFISPETYRGIATFFIGRYLQ
ncbi:MAG: hypothetical protein PHV33_00465 [Elusimicrobiales bacterium]|nr:hypothetical protein [Elusimicrobiales bacterium]